MRFNNVVVVAAILAIGLGLSACETSTADWSDKIQDKLNDMNLFGTAKKPLPGDRKEVFPGGAVPGVNPGVPPDLMPGGQQANAQPVPPPPPASPPAPVKKKKKVAAKKKNPTQTPPNANPAQDGVWPPPNSNAPPQPDNSVWPPPPK
jgi:hypothetical protein